MKYLLASASLFAIFLTTINAPHANDFVGDAIASAGKVHVTVLPCKNDIGSMWHHAEFDYFFENRTNINFKQFQLKITALDEYGQIIYSTFFGVERLRPNIRRAEKFTIVDTYCNDIDSVLVEDNYIALWETDGDEDPRLLQLLSFNWKDRTTLTTTFPSKHEADVPKHTYNRMPKLELKPLGIPGAGAFLDVGSCASEYHVSGGMGTVAYASEPLLLDFNSKMTINDLSNLPFSRTGGTLVNLNGEYVEFFQNSYPRLTRTLIVENNDLSSAKGEFVTINESNLLFTEGYAEFNKPECENMSYEESSRLHEHCYVNSQGISLLTIYKNGDLEAKAVSTYCVSD